MKVNNVSIFVGEDSQSSRKQLLGFTNQKEGNNSTFFAAALNGNIDPIGLKKQMAQKKAMKVVGDAFAADRKIDMEVADREAKIKKMRAENLEAKNALKDLEAQKQEIGKEYGLGKDGLSDEDMSILEKGSKMPSEMSDEEKARYQEMEKQGLTEYYSRCQDIDDLEESHKNLLADNDKLINSYEAANRAVHKSRLDLRNNPMIAAQEEAADIMEAAREEILGMLYDEGKDHIDEEMQEKVEQAQEAKEKKEEEEEKLEAIQENKAEIEEQVDAAREKARENEKRAEELIEALPMDEMLQMSGGTSDFQQELKDIMNKMKLVEEDLKGAAVDATL